MIASGFAVIGFSWITSPACTELEVIVMDWLAKFLNLPSQFLNSSEGPGGGIIQGSASESVLVALLSAREQAVRKHMAKHPEMPESDIRGRLIAYSSDQSNSCVEKAGLLAAVPIRLIPAGDDCILCGNAFEKAVQEDIANGKIPVICIATTGSTGTCAYDDLTSLGPVCQKYDIWLHVDAAYAGVAFCLPECQNLLKGMEYADSLNFNLHKAMKVNFDCTAMWLKDSEKVVDSFMVDRIYLKHQYQGQNPKAPDYRHWQIPLGRRFRALKVWIVLRTYGAEGIREHVRNYFKLSEQFEKYISTDNRFEITSERSIGLVCFRFKGDNNHLTKALLDRITERKKIYIIQAAHKGKNFLRFCVAGMDPKPEDIEFAWNEISSQADAVLREERAKITNGIGSDTKAGNLMAEKLNAVLTIEGECQEKAK
ncbi:unnamed protein product [Hermetia illucens]|uniref:Alpha-methyldopa hypersensitive protein n=2 Tax=Hermetia illucens TaxID=343691 RepID=A0A7R8YXU8_HERIL|nr:unnamed protein product [Hermetia illucens]